MSKAGPGTTLQGRLLGFACGQLALSLPVGLVLAVAWIALLFLLFLLEENRVVQLLWYGLPPLLMACYFPAGAVAARVRGWRETPERRVLVLSVLLPALAAWAWAAAGLCLFWTMEDGNVYQAWMFFGAIYASFLLGAPSVLLAASLWTGGIQVLEGLGLLRPGSAWGVLVVGVLAAGLLPSLLFTFGSLRQARRASTVEQGGMRGNLPATAMSSDCQPEKNSEPEEGER
ncbi:hypothetical protein [uncultured Pseudoflavonifractor sp.]|uniref:hypothetical protein n=1 Tax=uncultured Pseudoflavonifractor sp. TaxID=1221379 RepID=UPI0025D3C697|nr:hypothetical protein [uncultured Pseudoflavonifractor sp.]